jgi:hypothetical protein
MEINARAARGKIASHLLPMSTGWNSAEAIVEIALGNQRRPLPGMRNCNSKYSDSPKCSLPWSLHEANVRNLERVVDTTRLVPPGTKVCPPAAMEITSQSVIATSPSETLAMVRACYAAARVKLTYRSATIYLLGRSSPNSASAPQIIPQSIFIVQQ